MCSCIKAFSSSPGSPAQLLVNICVSGVGFVLVRVAVVGDLGVLLILVFVFVLEVMLVLGGRVLVIILDLDLVHVVVLGVILHACVVVGAVVILRAYVILPDCVVLHACVLLSACVTLHACVIPRAYVILSAYVVRLAVVVVRVLLIVDSGVDALVLLGIRLGVLLGVILTCAVVLAGGYLVFRGPVLHVGVGVPSGVVVLWVAADRGVSVAVVVMVCTFDVIVRVAFC